MKPIVFDPDRPVERINYIANCPAAIVAEICGQLSAGVTDIDVMCQALRDAGLWEDLEPRLCDVSWVVKSVLRMLGAICFLEPDLRGGHRICRPMSVGESFSQYFEENDEEV